MFLVECEFDVFSFLLKSVAYALSLFEKLPTVNKQLQGKKKNGNAHRATQFFFVNSFEYNLAKCVNETEKNCSYSELDLRKKAAASKQ